ncbi:MAG: hypothetical protein M3321_04140 [Actinomycetota bacterium]|nr:hypothetical protein [Actinomycetota bacterium]
MPGVPKPLLDLMRSLTLSGLPTTASPGDRITMRITPDLDRRGNPLPDALTDLTRGELLANVELDPDALLTWLVTNIRVSGWEKAVEFNQPVTAAAADLPQESPVQRALPHLIPSGAGAALLASTLVEGVISRLRLTRETTSGAASKLVGTITKPGIVGTMSAPTVEVRVFDETGAQLQSGDRYFQSTAFIPELVFLPVAVASAAQQPTIRRSISVHVAMTYTPPAIPNQPPPTAIPVTRDFGPFALDLATVEVPVVALLARHPLPAAGSAPGHVFVGVPQSSPLNGLGDVIGALGALRTVLGNVVTVLGLLGITVPTQISEALRVLDFVPTVAGDFRFGKGDLLGLWALFADWQYIMSAAMLLGPPSRRAFFGSILPPIPPGTPAAFSLFPSALGVGFIPNLDVDPITSGVVVGRATDDMPLPSGTYDNKLTSINFPAS